MCEIGFIMLRHVNSEITNKYWIRSYNCIRQFYPENIILIIDDNSDYSYITNEKLYKTLFINSAYPKRGEILPYYYYLQMKLFDIAVIIHDSVFINRYIDFSVDTYKFIWDFEHWFDQIEDETKMIKLYEDDELLNFYENKNLWKGCFGGMSIIKHDYLKYVNSKYDISKLLDHVVSRINRCSFERVIGCFLQKVEKKDSLLGNIHYYLNWKCNTTFDEIENFNHLPISKVFSGR
jgi:hypothetical protein